jgi:hypothetical protein
LLAGWDEEWEQIPCHLRKRKERRRGRGGGKEEKNDIFL